MRTETISSGITNVRASPRFAGRSLTAIIPFLARCSVAATLVYAVTVAYGIASGYPFPAAAVLKMLPGAKLFASFEPYLPYAILLTAIFGTALGWLATWGVIDPREVRKSEIVAARLLQRWGFFLIFAVLLICISDGGPAGVTSGDSRNYFSPAGLMPHSDGWSYFLSPFEQSISGKWNALASRRPFAAGFRQVTMMMAGFSYVGTLVLQALLTSVVLFAAARAVAQWRGLWCGVAFFSFVYLIDRAFLSSVWTEPLGVIWALLSIVFFVEAMRLKREFYAFLSLVAFALAELTRMGSMFSIPVFALWLAIAFAETPRHRVRLIVISVSLLVLLLGGQTILAGLYGDPAGSVGGNFAYTICGLALGGFWMTCQAALAPQLGSLATEGAAVGFAYSKAAQFAYAHPAVILQAMWNNVHAFLADMPLFLLSGYGAGFHPRLSWLFVLFVPGFYLAFQRRRRNGEFLFWVVMFGSMAASAALVFADDGWRVMFATWPLVAFFFAFGLTSPCTVAPFRNRDPSRFARTAAVCVGAVILFAFIAPAIARVWPGAQLASLADTQFRGGSSARVVLIARSVAGFAVIPDGADAPDKIPALTASQFTELARKIGLERDFGNFLQDALTRLPFAFITAARIDSSPQPEQYYIAPVRILAEHRPIAWRATLGDRIRHAQLNEIVALEGIR